MPTDFQIFTFNAEQGKTFVQWLKDRDNEGWELITIMSSGSSPKWTFIQAVFKKKV